MKHLGMTTEQMKAQHVVREELQHLRRIISLEQGTVEELTAHKATVKELAATLRSNVEKAMRRSHQEL